MWAAEIEPNIFICGDITGSVLHAYIIPDGEDFFYGVNAEGVITQEYTLSDKSSLLNMLNAHFGTSFTNYVPVELPLYNIGDSFPNWSAYEKIIKIDFVKIIDSITPTYAIGEIKNGTFYCYAKSETLYYNCDVDGVITKDSLILDRIIPYWESFEDIESVEPLIKNFEIGQRLADFNSFRLLEM